MFVDSARSVLADVTVESISGTRGLASYEIEFGCSVNFGGGRCVLIPINLDGRSDLNWTGDPTQSGRFRQRRCWEAPN